MTGDLPAPVELPSWLGRYPVVLYAVLSTYDTLRRDLAGSSGRVFVKPGICRIPASEQIEVLRRLATDQRMERVWTELYRKKRGSNEFLNPVQWEGLRLFDGKQLSTLHDPQHQHTAVAEFFYHAWFFAVVGLPLTQDEINSRIKPYTIMASKLRRNAEGLRALGLNELAADVESVATSCENRLQAPSNNILYPIVKRSRGDAVMRQYVLKMSALCRRGFGKALPGTIATTASVALSKNISGAQVREIVGATTPGLIPSAESKIKHPGAIPSAEFKISTGLLKTKPID
jgi:hypothetical protein